MALNVACHARSPAPVLGPRPASPTVDGTNLAPGTRAELRVSTGNTYVTQVRLPQP